GALDLPLRPDVDRARGLVEDQDPRVGQQGARERDQLSLAEREARAALTELRVVALLEPLDELVGADRPRRGDDLLVGCTGPAEGDVLGDGAREEEAFLRDDPELTAKRRLRDRAQVHDVDRD